MKITSSTDPDDADRKALMRLMDAHNDAATGLTDPVRKLSLLVHDDAGVVRGGLWGFSYYRWMFIDLLILADELRHAGLGTRLMAEAEAEARRRDLLGIWLDTFSFQARPFYERLGFRLCGQIDDFPPGGARYFLCKRLDGG